jgi:hypothetical protein
MSLHIEHRTDGYWIVGLPAGFRDCGPYRTKQEATEAKRGIGRFFLDEWQLSPIGDKTPIEPGILF